MTRDHKSMMADPQRWPRWPWLPMKNFEQLPVPVFACMHADTYVDSKPFPLYKLNICERVPYFPNDSLTKIEFPDIDACLAAGWVVD